MIAKKKLVFLSFSVAFFYALTIESVVMRLFVKFIIRLISTTARQRRQQFFAFFPFLLNF